MPGIFDRLQAIRADSPTGGALGQISEREMEIIIRNLNKLEDREGLGQISDKELKLLMRKSLGQVSERELELLGRNKVKKMAHGGRVTRPIDGRATKGLTRGSRRT